MNRPPRRRGDRSLSRPQRVRFQVPALRAKPSGRQRDWIGHGPAGLNERSVAPRNVPFAGVRRRRLAESTRFGVAVLRFPHLPPRLLTEVRVERSRPAADRLTASTSALLALTRSRSWSRPWPSGGARCWPTPSNPVQLPIRTLIKSHQARGDLVVDLSVKSIDHEKPDNNNAERPHPASDDQKANGDQRDEFRGNDKPLQ
jgi:hypothetical protein